MLLARCLSAWFGAMEAAEATESTFSRWDPEAVMGRFLVAVARGLIEPGIRTSRLGWGWQSETLSCGQGEWRLRVTDCWSWESFCLLPHFLGEETEARLPGRHMVSQGQGRKDTEA